MGLDAIFTSAGWRLPFFCSGNSPLLSHNHDASITALNALGKITIKRDPAATEDRVIYSPDNIVILLAQQLNSASGGSGQFKVVSIDTAPADSDSTISCIDMTGGFDGVAITVAKPPKLRGLTGNQYAYPAYTESNLLLAVNIAGGIGSSVEWIDINIDGRNIARETEGCDEEGNPQYALVVRNAWYADPVGADFT